MTDNPHIYTHPAVAPTSSRGTGPLRQWRMVKTTGDKMNIVFQNIADEDGQVELVTYIGGRDFTVCYSWVVER